MLRFASIACPALLLSLIGAPTVAADHDFFAPLPKFLPIGEPAKPPADWANYCARYRSECGGQSEHVQALDLNVDTWLKLVSVNTWANRSIKAETDAEHWGIADHWDNPQDGVGDCEDFAILKRQTLIAMGVPQETLLLTVVWDKDNAGHAVLTAHTSQGDLILDNRTSAILLWSDTGYDFVKRQTQSNPNEWVYVDGLTWSGGTMVASAGTPGNGQNCTQASCAAQTATATAPPFLHP